MKNYIFLSLFIIGLLSACTDNLDVTPTFYQDTQEALSTPEGLMSLRNSSYAYTRSVYGNYFYHFSEMLADTGEIIFVGTYKTLQDLYNKSLVPTFAWGEFSWRDAYRAINGCNLILDNLSVVEDPSLRNRLEGDARYLRANLYFDLVRFFSLPYGTNAMTTLAVPIIETGVSDPNGVTYPAKSTVQEVFDLVESDLLQAHTLLTDFDNETFFASKYSPMVTLTRLYLTTEDYTKAAQFADSVIESDKFELMLDPFYSFNQSVNSSEDITTWHQTELDNEGANNAGMTAFYASTNAVGRSEMVISEDFLANTFEANDLRGIVQFGLSSHSEITSMYYEGFGTRARGIYSSKWLEYNTNMTFSRLAEMYLTRAEANQMIMDAGGTMVGSYSPVDDINEIRGRANLTPIGTVTIDEIQYERYRELIFEGHRLHDYKRWKQDVGTIPWDSDRLIIPVPKKETDTNPNL